MQIQSQGHTREAVLRFRFDGTSLTGTLAEEGRDPRELSNVLVAGGKVSFDLEERSGTLHAQGVVEDEILSGKMKRRRPEGSGGGPTFSMGGHGGRTGGRHEGSRGDEDGGAESSASQSWTAYRRHTTEPAPAAPHGEGVAAAGEAAPSAPAVPAPRSAAEAADARLHVRYGSIARAEPLILTAAGARIAFTSSMSLADGRYVPDPYVGRCALLTVKYTMKIEDQKSVLGDSYTAPDPEADDPLVLHPTELRNAAGRFGANAVYLRLNGSEELSASPPLHGCTILDRVGDRLRGESLNEVACRGEDGKVFKFSQYGGRASFYACPPAGGARSGRRKGR